MTANHQFPKLRAVQPELILYQGQHYFLLRDPLRLKENVMLLPDALLPLLFLCDGTRDKETLLHLFKSQFEIHLGDDVLDYFLNMFDEMYLLENERASHARQRLIADYRAAPFRKPASAGNSYPNTPAELHHLLQNYLEAAETEPALDGGMGLLSPHIDYPRGGPVYAQVWKRAARMVETADLFIVLGTDHQGGHNPITLTRQNYATPYGVLPTEQSVVDVLVDVLGEENAFAGELYHRNEHSLELVLNWLHHLRGGQPVPVVPILVGWLTMPELTSDSNPNGFIPLNEPLIDALVAAVHRATRGRKVCYIISGDLAHVGPAFSGPPLDAAAKTAIQTADEDLFRLLSAGDAQTFITKLLAEYEPNNVCGAFPTYLGMRMMGAVKGEQIGYAQCPADEAGTSIVSVGGVVFQ